jgi:hypothetical protein
VVIKFVAIAAPPKRNAESNTTIFFISVSLSYCCLVTLALVVFVRNRFEQKKPPQQEGSAMNVISMAVY